MGNPLGLARDILEKLRRAADIRSARVVGPSGIAGQWRVIRGADGAPTLAVGSGSYAPGQVVPIGSYQGGPRQAILTGSIPGTAGSSAYPMLPARVEVVSTGPTIESADPAEITDEALMVVVELTGLRFRQTHLVAVVAWDPVAQDWIDDPRVTVVSQSYVSPTQIDVTLSATPAANGGGLPLLQFAIE